MVAGSYIGGSFLVIIMELKGQTQRRDISLI
jgi:hypothetical protein